MIKFLKKLIHIVNTYEENRIKDKKYLDNVIRLVDKDLKDATNLIKERTTINIDHGFEGPSCIIILGRYKNNDYVEVKYMTDNSLYNLVNELKNMERNGKINRIDTNPHIRKMIKHELDLSRLASEDWQQ